jgi:hypothetical protein
VRGTAKAAVKVHQGIAVAEHRFDDLADRDDMSGVLDDLFEAALEGGERAARDRHAGPLRMRAAAVR